jgi:hypothetical protein
MPFHPIQLFVQFVLAKRSNRKLTYYRRDHPNWPMWRSRGIIT